MAISLTTDETRAGTLPASPRIGGGPGRVVLSGHRNASEPVYVHVARDSVVVADTMTEILAAMDRTGPALEIDPHAICGILGMDVVRLPTTVFRGVYELGMGDQLEIVPSDAGLVAGLHGTYPFLNSRSRQDQKPDTGRLLELMTTAVDRTVRDRGRGVLMLSSGKDSVGLALALANGGHSDVEAVTYRADGDDPEWRYADELCKRLGIAHTTLSPPSPDEVRDIMTAVFESSPVPCGDVLIQYAHAAKTVSGRASFMLDGSGNDSYMGYGPDHRTNLKLRYRVRGRRLGQLLARLTPVDSPLNYVLRSRATAPLPLRLYRDHEIAAIYPDAVPVHREWYELSRQLRHLDNWDLMGSTGERWGEPTAVMLKGRLAAGAFGMGCLFPYGDADLIDYCFNLPEEHRFDRKRRQNKLLLRQMLDEQLGYDPAQVGANPFRFDGARFFLDNRDFVLDEIRRCRLWSPTAPVVAERAIERLPKRPTVYHSLQVLFQISGWYNHSRHLRSATTAEVPA